MKGEVYPPLWWKIGFLIPLVILVTPVFIGWSRGSGLLVDIRVALTVLFVGLLFIGGFERKEGDQL